jgi:hypothetical protein
MLRSPTLFRRALYLIGTAAVVLSFLAQIVRGDCPTP